jgi:hypothetical protein
MPTLKNIYILYGDTYNWKKVAHSVLGNILLLQILKSTLAKKKISKGENVPLGLLKKVISLYLEEKWFAFGKGHYTRCEGTLFIWIDSKLHRRMIFVEVKVTWPYEPSNGMYVGCMLIFL